MLVHGAGIAFFMLAGKSGKTFPALTILTQMIGPTSYRGPERRTAEKQPKKALV